VLYIIEKVINNFTKLIAGKMVKKMMNIIVGAVFMFSLFHLEKRAVSFYETGSICRRIRGIPNGSQRETMNYDEFKGRAILIPEGKADITSADSLKPFIFGAVRDCVLVTLYYESKQERIGGMAHITTARSPGVATVLESLFDKFREKKVEINNLKARIIGGKTGLSEQTISQIITILTQNGIQIIEKDILGDKWRAIVMDIQEGGQIFDITGIR